MDRGAWRATAHESHRVRRDWSDLTHTHICIHICVWAYMYTWASQLAQWHWLSSAGPTGDMGSISGLGRSPEEGNGSPLPYSCWENLMDRRAWRATVYGLARVGHDLVTKPPPLRTLCCAACHTHRGPQRDLTAYPVLCCVPHTQGTPARSDCSGLPQDLLLPRACWHGDGVGSRQLWEAEKVPRQSGGLPRAGSNNICTY